jgi:hypothetical protein
MINAKKLATSTHEGTTRLIDSYQSGACQSDTDKKGVLGARKKIKGPPLKLKSEHSYQEEQLTFPEMSTPTTRRDEEREDCC